MRHRKSLVALLIAGLIISGCHTPSTTTVSEYRPRLQRVNETQTPSAGVFQLVRWTPVAPLNSATTQPVATAKPAKQIPIEVEQVYMSRGQPLGFRREGGQLIAVSAISTVHLEDAHYEWRTLPRRGNDLGEGLANFGNAVTGTLFVVAVAVTVVGLVYLSLRDDCQQQQNPAGQ
jgi:hypothetical protein